MQKPPILVIGRESPLLLWDLIGVPGDDSLGKGNRGASEVWSGSPHPCPGDCFSLAAPFLGQAELPRYVRSVPCYPVCSVLHELRSPPAQTPSNLPAVCCPLAGAGVPKGDREEMCVRNPGLEKHNPAVSFLSGDSEGRVVHSFYKYLLSTSCFRSD